MVTLELVNQEWAGLGAVVFEAIPNLSPKKAAIDLEISEWASRVLEESVGQVYPVVQVTQYRETEDSGKEFLVLVTKVLVE